MKNSYVLSDYNYIQKLKDSRILVWNTYTGSLFLLEENEYNELQALCGETFDKNCQIYKDAGFILLENEREKQFEDILKSRQEIYENQNGEISFRILTTTACNARCAYCYECGIKTINMSQIDAVNIVNFIVKRSQFFKQINITWFGGEPLILHEKISFITRELKEKCKDKILKFDIVTNGILFNYDLVQKAANEWSITDVQITLDGTKSNYERIKNYYNVPNAFDKICENIKLLIKADIHISIRLNVDKNNYQDLMMLIFELRENFENKVDVYASPLFSTDTFNGGVIDDEELVQCMGDVLKALKDAGYIKQIITFQHGKTCACGSILPNNFVIMPNGNLVKCPSEIGQENCILGDVRTGIENQERADKWSSYLVREECKKCCFLPTCQGGCLASMFCKTNSRVCSLDKYMLAGLIDRFIDEEPIG